MLQGQRQIVSTVDNQIDKDPVGTKYAITSFDYMAQIFISVIVTINRTVLMQKYQSSNSHCIMMITTTKLRSSI
jgi:hypothetical protein